MLGVVKLAKFFNIASVCKISYCAMSVSSTSIKDEILSMPELKLLADLFNSNGHRLRLAGGVVRDILLNVKPNDYDLASDATPDKMIAMLENKPNIRLITTPAGERHGTVAALINGSKMFEITTLRIDKITDGRHAEVEFIQDWKLDALRRDFTINSIFMDLDGTVIDYYDGEKDLKSGMLRFVGDPVCRIKEDYLRIMRYFRFYARFGRQDHDEKTIQAMKDNVDGLSTISGERIWLEVKKTLQYQSCNKVVPLMAQVNVLPYMGFHTKTKPMDLTEFHRVHANVWKMPTSYEPVTLFTSLIRSEEELDDIILRLKLSNFEKEVSLFLIVARYENNHTLHSLKKRLSLSSKSVHKSIKRYTLELLKYNGLNDIFDDLENWEIPMFPLRGDKIGNKIKKRSLIGKIMNELKIIWADSEFKLTEQELINELDKLIKKYQDDN